jgi:hypothetical protein
LEETEDYGRFYTDYEGELQRYRKYGLPLNIEAEQSFKAKPEIRI